MPRTRPRNFLPQSGTIVAFAPAVAEGVRTDHGIASGWTVSPFYDPMLAKVIAYGATREEARRRLISALEDTLLVGLADNAQFLVAMLRHPTFAAGDATTGFIGAHFAKGSDAVKRPSPPPRVLALAAVLFASRDKGASKIVSHWSSAGAAQTPIRLAIGETSIATFVTAADGRRFRVRIGDVEQDVAILSRDGDRVRYRVGDVQAGARIVTDGATLYIATSGGTFAIRDASHETARAGAKERDATMRAPMNGRIVAVLAKAGDSIAKGQRIVILEAMKMQHEILAPRDGQLASVNVSEGDQVATRQILAAMTEATA